MKNLTLKLSQSSLINLNFKQKFNTLAAHLTIFTWLFLLNTQLLYSQDFWQIMSNNDSVYIHDIVLDSQGRIYLATTDFNNNHGGVFRSDDNGETWVRKVNGMTNFYTKSIACDKDNTLFATTSGDIYKSNDYGDNWQKLEYQSIYAYDRYVSECGYDSVILVGGEYDQGILRSTNKGESWEIVLDLYHTNYQEHISDICFGKNNIIYASSFVTWFSGYRKSAVYQSVDYGKTWTVMLESINNENYYSLAFDNENRLIVGGYGISRYDFNTSSWEHIQSPIADDILVIPDDKIFLSSETLGVRVSDDGGDSYTRFENVGLVYNEARKFDVDTSGRLLLISWHEVYRSNDVIFTSNEMNHLIVSSLLKCYPNPFTDYTTIKSLHNQPMQITFLNSIGEIIIETKIPAMGEFTFEAQSLPPGIYIAKINFGIRQEVIKLLHY